MVLHTDAPPLKEDAAGALRVGNSRVLLELVIRAFQDGATPETIVQRYATLVLSDVYAVVAYYLRHRAEIDTYLAARDKLGQQIRSKIETNQSDVAEISARVDN